MSWCSRDLHRGATGACSWLIENGADPWKLAPDRISTVAHHLYSQIGQQIFIGSSYSHLQDLQDHVFGLTGKLARRDPRDNCRCSCSPGGCTPFVWLLRAAIDPMSVSASELVEHFLAVLRNTHGCLTTAHIWSAIRFATFETLGIRHTCHDDHQNEPLKRADEEIDELHQEDRFLSDLLEDLMEDFESELPR